MMSLVRTIPHEPIYAVSRVGKRGATVSVVRASDERTIATIRPFGAARGPLALAVGDVDGDIVPDVAIATGRGATTTVKVYSGASGYRQVIRRLQPFGSSSTGASVALGDLNGDGLDEIVAGQRAGGRPRVVVIDASTGNRLADFEAFDHDFRGGVSVATGMVEAGGRISLFTAAGPGRRPTVKMYNFDLFGDASGRMPKTHARLTPLEVASFDGAARGYRGGVTVTTGYPFALDGGFATVLVTTSSGPARMNAYTVSEHQHGPQVAPSGAMKPHSYEPGAPRVVTLRQAVDLGTDRAFRSGAITASVSNTANAMLLIAPRHGGRLTGWEASGRGEDLAPVGYQSVAGDGVAGM
jgi:hypothetical protein